jgi:prevent-host-death family protein
VEFWLSDGYNLTMSTHSVAEARNRLSELIDRALAGEGVTITRHGHPVVELKPVAAAPGPVTAQDLDWLAARRVGDRGPEDAGAFVSRMRDEEER